MITHLGIEFLDQLRGPNGITVCVNVSRVYSVQCFRYLRFKCIYRGRDKIVTEDIIYSILYCKIY